MFTKPPVVPVYVCIQYNTIHNNNNNNNKSSIGNRGVQMKSNNLPILAEVSRFSFSLFILPENHTSTRNSRHCRKQDSSLASPINSPSFLPVSELRCVSAIATVETPNNTPGFLVEDKL